MFEHWIFNKVFSIKWNRSKMVVFKLQLFFKEPYSFPCCFLPFTFQLLVSVCRYVCDCFCNFAFWMVDSVQIIDMNIQCAFEHLVFIHMVPFCLVFHIKYWISYMKFLVPIIVVVVCVILGVRVTWQLDKQSRIFLSLDTLFVL